MIRIPRWLVASLGTLFALFHAALGIWSLGSYQAPSLAATAIVIYLVAVLPSVILYRPEKLPIEQALFNFAAAVLVPLLINSHLDPDQADAYSTWYVMGIATLMATTAVRQQIVLAWAGTIVMVGQVFAWRGFIDGLQIGVYGAVLLIFAGHTISIGLQRAYRDTMEFTQEAIEIRSQQASNAAASQERSERLENAMRGALPMLTTIRNQHGALDDNQKLEARLLEASLRDEIRGRGLINPQVREAVKLARLRGVEVILLDEGGLDHVEQERKEEILFKASEAISKVASGRVTLRAPAGESWCVTLVATRPGIAKPDLWLKF